MHLETIDETNAATAGLWKMLSQLGDACLLAEGLFFACQATVVATDDEGIRRVNLLQRGLHKPTDVLSFPSVRYKKGTARDEASRLKKELDPETGCAHLGDIVISLERAAAQAAEYGHSPQRETGFLFVHGLLHLLGYDHETEKDRTRMRAMEEMIMCKAGLFRELTGEDLALAQGAREAMKAAYAPYSKYRVGACVRAKDGRLFSGCNVENASYGMTLCAERNAITTAVAAGAREIETIAIAAEGPMPYPCGACRQTMREFARDMRVILVNGETVAFTTLGALLPDSFGPESIKEVRP